MTITIRPVETFAELRAVEEMQKEVWGIPDLDVVPLTHLVAVKEAGGVLLGAFDREALAGFVYGFVAHEDGEIAHHSHMLAVKHDYRNFNLGYKLKLAQREAVLAQGINLITWRASGANARVARSPKRSVRVTSSSISIDGRTLGRTF